MGLRSRGPRGRTRSGEAQPRIGRPTRGAFRPPECAALYPATVRSGLVVVRDDDLDAVLRLFGRRVVSGGEIDVEGLRTLGRPVADDRHVDRAVLLALSELHDDSAEIDVVAARLGRPVARPPRDGRSTAVAAIAQDQNGGGR